MNETNNIGGKRPEKDQTIQQNKIPDFDESGTKKLTEGKCIKGRIKYARWPTGIRAPCSCDTEIDAFPLIGEQKRRLLIL